MAKTNRPSRNNGHRGNGRLAKTNRVESQVERFHHRDIIVIGGSAGCLGPLKTLVSGFPANLRAAIFVTVHVSPESPSILPAILTRAGELPAVHPLNRQPIMKSTIYVAPPDHHLLIEDGCVLSSRGPRENLHRPAIDPLFRSAARAYGPRVIGIVLSGLLDDGSSGLMAVKLKGGLAVVQDPAEAAFPEMPERAWHYAGAEYVLPISGIERLIVNSANGGARAPRSGQQKGSKTKSGKAMGAGISAGKALALETQTADIENPTEKEHVGMPSVYACPDCHGVLWEVKEGNLFRYRCRVGHAYTAETLNMAFTNSVEDTLWAGMRALEEKADLLRRMANRSGQQTAARYGEEAERMEKHAAAIRDMLGEDGSAVAEESPVMDAEKPAE